ncbi:MAG: hypothetical protein RRC07_02885 [Anaerolineae bacterium]|nr:hypothetical protein [Anaerolineae bacterium]
MRSRPLLLLLLVLALPALACNFVDQLLEPAPTFAPPPTDPGVQPPPDGTAAPFPTPIGGDTGQPTPAATDGDTATPVSLAELGTPPDEAVALADWLNQAFAAQASVGELCAVLRAAFWMPDDAACQAADLDGVTPDEWLLALYLEPTPDPASADSVQGPPGDLWIVGENGLLYQMHGLGSSDLFGQLPELVQLVDMTGDDQDDAVLRYVTCGAHTCFNNYQIVSAEGGSVRNIVDTGEEAVPELVDFISMAYVEDEQIEDGTDDDLPDLVISGGLIGSAGAGIQRPFQEIWAWDGTNVTLAEREWEDTGYRFHRLYNANAAFDEQEYDEARALYESVIVDATLEDVDYAYTVEAVRAYTRQFAAFRLALLPLLRGDITEATRWQNWMSQEYAGSPMGNATALLIQTWQQNGNNMPAACDQVTNYLAGQDSPTGPLEDMGYGNPALTADDVCPF